jgi:UDP-N-acetylglucosamine pyrophosphorylase
MPFLEQGKFGALRVSREEEFAPVKNANKEGEEVVDSPASAKRMVLELHSKWIAKCGVELASSLVEIDGLLSYQGEGKNLEGLVNSKLSGISVDEEMHLQ